MQEPKINKPDSLISYVVQRHGQLSLSCEMFEKFGVPLRRFSSIEDDTDVSTEDAFRNYQLALAMNIHPEIVEWFGMHARSNLAECRFMAEKGRTKRLKPIEDLIQRDIDAINGSRGFFESFPEETQKVIEINSAKRLQTVLALDTPRILCALSGPVLYTWQNEWFEALKVTGDVFGGVPAPETSAMTALDHRIGEVESDVYWIRRQMAIAAEVFRPPADGGDRE